MLKRRDAFTINPLRGLILDDGRICLTNNAAERGLRGIALGRKAWLFAGSDRGDERAAAMYLAHQRIGRFADHPVQRPHELLPWNWHEQTTETTGAA
jgi:hypothetical protein